MSRRIVSVVSIATPVATADTTALADASYPFLLQGGSATQLNRVHEVSITGQAAAASSPTFTILSRDTTVAVTNSNGAGQTDAPIDPAVAALALPALTGNTNTTKPQRSATAHLLNCSLNAFGGNFFWRANKIEEAFPVLGNTQPLGEVSLSAFTGGTPGAIGAHMVYESL